MKLTFNRPPKVSVLRELDSLGFPIDQRTTPAHEDSFPSIINTDYIEVWDKFLETTAAAELMSRGIDVLYGNLNTTLGFISYLSLITSNPLTAKYNLNRVSELNIVTALHDLKGALPRWLKSRRIDKSFKIREVDIQLEDTYNDFIGTYVDVGAAIYLTFEPARRKKLKRGDIGTSLVDNSLDPLLYERQRYMFKGEVPKQLKSETRKLGAASKVKHKYLDLQAVKKRRTTLWYLMDAVGNTNIFAHRSGENRFTLKFTINTPAIYYCGSESKNKMKKRIESLIETTLNLR